jgi:hypothetical protein
VFAVAKVAQICDAPGSRFGLVPSPQPNVELENGSEIVVEREPASRRKAFPLQRFQVSNEFSQVTVWYQIAISCRNTVILMWVENCSAWPTRSSGDDPASSSSDNWHHAIN